MKLKRRIKPLILRTLKEDEPIEEIENDNINNDWDFSFDEYEKEEQIIDDSITSITDKKPRTSNYISKFGAGLSSIEILMNLKNTIADKSIIVASRFCELKDVGLLYGCLNETWAQLRDVHGSIIITQIDNLDKLVLKNLLGSQKQSKIPEELIDQILHYRNKLYTLLQRARLGVEVERKQGSAFGKAKTGMIE